MEQSRETKELYGSSLYALMSVTTRAKWTGSAKQAKLQGGVISAILGGTYATGTRIGVPSEVMGSAATTYTALNVTGFEDLGVRDSSGYQVTKKASAPSAGEYSVTNLGVYTFGTSGVYTVSYSYTAVSGKTVSVKNGTIGLSPTFQLGLYNTGPDGKKSGLKFYAATFSNWSGDFSAEEFTMPEAKFTCTADGSDNVFDLYLPDAE
jgi:hypothetical protein